MKKIILIFIFILSFSVFQQSEIFSRAESEQMIIVNTTFTQAYETKDYSSPCDFTIPEQTLLSLKEESDGFYKVEYRRNINNEIHVCTCYIPTEFASIFVKPKENIIEFNGKVLVKSEIFSITSDAKLEGVVLEKDHQIFLFEGFESDEKYNKIKFALNGNIYTGKILTTNIVPNGINKVVIIALSIIISLVSIILILFGIKKKKKKKMA